MATASIPGFKAAFYLATSSSGGAFQKFGEIASATLTVAGGAMDATSKDSGGWRENLPGLREWSIAGEGLYLLESSDAGQLAMFNALTGGVPVYVNLRESVNSTTTYVGLAVVTGFDIDAPVDGAVKGKIALKGTNVLTKAAATS